MCINDRGNKDTRGRLVGDFFFVRRLGEGAIRYDQLVLCVQIPFSSLAQCLHTDMDPVGAPIRSAK